MAKLKGGALLGLVMECKPTVLYLFFMAALILYFVTQGQFRRAGVNVGITVIGALFLWLLCRLGFDTAAWIFLFFPAFFFISVLALLLVTKIVKTNVRYNGDSEEVLYGNSSYESNFDANGEPISKGWFDWFWALFRTNYQFSPGGGFTGYAMSIDDMHGPINTACCPKPGPCSSCSG